jgi:methylmalonyl-CoA mutase
LHTNSFDEALALPSESSARIARNTQLIIAEETHIPQVIDPMGGSYYVETLTHSLVVEAQKLIAEVEKLGGMTKAIQAGIPKFKIEESAARRQAMIDQKKEIVVGVNKYPPPEKTEVKTLEVDNTKVRETQIRRLKEVKARRNYEEVEAALNAITEAAQSNKNLLALSIEAARKRATLGEISKAMEKVYGRYQETCQIVSGVYVAEYKQNPEFQALLKEVQDFAKEHGRRPRILIAKLGQDGHDRGAHTIASAFADLGFDVDLGPLFQTPQECATMAIENDVHTIGVSSLAAGHKTLVPQLIEELKKAGGQEIFVVIGGVIPPQDYKYLYEVGVQEIFGPGTNVLDAARKVLMVLNKTRPTQPSTVPSV